MSLIGNEGLFSAGAATASVDMTHGGATQFALSARNLQKTYAGDVLALKNVSLNVEQGDFFALLGPNGAGKSTLIGIISSLVNKSSGQVSVFGHDLDREPHAVRANIGLVPQEFNFNVFEAVQDIVMNSAGYHGIKRPVAKQRAEYYLRLLELWDKRAAPARTLSGGMKRRLMIARALVHEPGLIILDEPTAGVDIEIRRSMWEFLSRINDEGKSIILTTHYLEEAETLCRNVAVIDNGEVIEQGPVASLLSQAMTQTFVFDLQNPDVLSLPPSLSVRGADTSSGKDENILLQLEDDQLEAVLPKGVALDSVFDLLRSQNVQVNSMRTKSNRLETFFLQLVNQSESDSDSTMVE